MVSACSHSSLDIVVGLGMKIVIDRFPLFSSTLEFGAREPGRDVLHCIESVRIGLWEIKGAYMTGRCQLARLLEQRLVKMYLLTSQPTRRIRHLQVSCRSHR